MTPDDLRHLTWASDPRVSPDGSRVAYVVTRIDVDDNRYRSRVWLAAADGSTPPRPLTVGDPAETQPRWSPDGTWLAFTSKREPSDATSADDPTHSLHVLPIDGPGETVTLATANEAFEQIAWSPDGTRLAYVRHVRSERYADQPDRQSPRQVTTLLNRLDSVGWLLDRPSQVHTVPIDGSAAPTNHTPDAPNHAWPAWLPDSRHLVVAAARHDGWDLDLTTSAWLVDTRDEVEPRPLTAHAGEYGYPAVSPDGTRVALLGYDDPLLAPQNHHVGLIDVGPAGSGADARAERPRWISSDIDRNWAPFPGARPPIWLDDRTLLAAYEDRGTVQLATVSVDGDAPAHVAGDHRHIAGWDRAGDTLALAVGTFDRPHEIHTVIGGVERRISTVTEHFVARCRPVGAEHFLVPSSDGAEVDAWILRPPDFDPDRSYPALLNVHGGPFTQYSTGFFDEFQVQAAAGYVVVTSNPRGGSGREESWGQAITGPDHPKAPDGRGWGSVDYDDVIAVVDAALERFTFIDAERFGILGGSYGGYMASWVVAHTNRFAAACSERSANNLLTLETASDAAGFFRAYTGATHFDDPDRFLRHSPITYVRGIRTPLLILHSENDLRCPVEQADQLFVALRLLEREVEYHRFPAESHELTRSGSPVHRVQRFELLLDFFGRHLHP